MPDYRVPTGTGSDDAVDRAAVDGTPTSVAFLASHGGYFREPGRHRRDPDAWALALIFREYVEIDRAVKACFDTGELLCFVEPSAFPRDSRFTPVSAWPRPSCSSRLQLGRRTTNQQPGLRAGVAALGAGDIVGSAETDGRARASRRRSLGFGGTLAKYASEGVDVFLLTATRGDAGRYRGQPPTAAHPGPRALAAIREAELRAAAGVLGVREVTLLDYHDRSSIARTRARRSAASPAHLRRVRPDVVLTFGPDGAYGHPDHIAISQFTTAAIVAAADPRSRRRIGEADRAARGVEALLHGVAGIDVGGLPGGVQEADLHGRRRRAAGDAVARLGDHDRDRHAQLLADGLAGDLVPRVADGRVRALEATCRRSTMRRCGAGSRSIACSAR